VNLATLNIPFTDEGIGQGNEKIVLQQMATRMDFNGELTARCFPSSGVTFVASVGTIRPGEVREQLVMSEAIKFSNSSSGELQYPKARTVTIQHGVLMQKTKNIYGKTVIVPASGVTLRFDAEQNAIVALGRDGQAVAVYGGCVVSYAADYQVLYYIPDVNRIGFTGGYSFAVGTIFGYTETDVQTLEMKLDWEATPDWIEFARVTSKIVLDYRGVWEFPAEWRNQFKANRTELNPNNRQPYTNDTFQEFNNSDYELDYESCFIDTRVHMIVKINSYGSLLYDDLNNGGDGYWAWNTPYFGYASFDPWYEIEFMDPPGGAKASSAEDFKRDLNHRTWRDVFLQIKKADLIARLSEEYPSLEEYLKTKVQT
jgi:hypothetical protein